MTNQKGNYLEQSDFDLQKILEKSELIYFVYIFVYLCSMIYDFYNA